MEGPPGGFWGSEDISVSEEDFSGHIRGILKDLGEGVPGFGASGWKISPAISGMGVGGRENSWDV